ncbi:MAG: thioredoxin-disulfide reductase [Erysipelotrichaceae bacterium]|nr:thioredoxin-disulfide reductase [Erysipelotrichaceae bacterium]
MERQYDLVIIGAGPAGMSAAVYGSRAGLKTVIIENAAPGGKLTKTHKISNYPGVGEQGGADLAAKMFEQALMFGATYEYGNVIKVNADKTVELEDGTVIEAKAVIVATGTKERSLNIPGEAQAIGKGVSFCAVCDGAFFRDKDVVVIGGGNSALEESVFLTQFVNQVTIVIRRDVFRAEENIQNQIKDNPKIKVITKHIPKEVLLEEGKVCGIRIENVDTGQTQDLACDGIFPYVGQDPMSQALRDLDVLDANGYVLVDSHMQTKVEGIYAAGDINAKELRQVVTATNDGAIAAQHAFHQITGK